MTVVWFVVWLIANNVGTTESLTFDPVNVWAGTLLLCVALDLGSHHTQYANSAAKSKKKQANKSVPPA